MTLPEDSTAQRRSAFAEPLFRRYYPSSIFSALGSWIVRFLVGWSAWEMTHAAVWVGIVAGLMLAPTLFLSPVFGIVADRINPRNGIIATLGLHGVIAAIAAFASHTGALSLPWLLVLAVSLGAAAAAHTPIRLALIPKLVTRGALPGAIGISAMTFNTARILGPAVGAWLIAHFSVTTAFATGAALFACTVPVLLLLHGVESPAARARTSFVAQLRDGLRYTRGHPGIRLVFAFTVVNGLSGRTAIELLPAISGQMLNGDSTTLATLTASAGAGSIAGGLLVSRQSGRESLMLSLVAAGLAINGGALMLANWLQGLTTFCVLVALISMVTTVGGTGTQALAQLTVAEDFRGRVLSLWTVLAMGAPAVGGLLMGTLADFFGFPLVLTIFGAAVMIAVLLLYRRRNALLAADSADAA